MNPEELNLEILMQNSPYGNNATRAYKHKYTETGNHTMGSKYEHNQEKDIDNDTCIKIKRNRHIHIYIYTKAVDNAFNTKRKEHNINATST